MIFFFHFSIWALLHIYSFFKLHSFGLIPFSLSDRYRERRNAVAYYVEIQIRAFIEEDFWSRFYQIKFSIEHAKNYVLQVFSLTLFSNCNYSYSYCMINISECKFIIPIKTANSRHLLDLRIRKYFNVFFLMLCICEMYTFS